ncbi:TIGR03364 family FAD-dependent oxidoreductase [Gordonia hankookensis]|uniref:TIGR03364 family FAD-dependent oxidoreductase n=1 Tax=Gordonia hankookensis TaxID=589403 RepID=A0ABR7WF99_9ACTN|nr:TIGR03364 family FAD-dependent oxidoreductase [Gordonia hankookensis]MBD1321345.1 TIGR03364 family FAD-dependent oxidoreductase [Gordonia hankookensis]
MKIIVIGGGILGTAHAWSAVVRGHRVVQIEREREARGATVRNFGLVWISGRAPGELGAAQRSRDLWEKIGTEVPGIGFRPCGSLTMVRTAAELAVAEDVSTRPDAADRGFTLLDPEAVRQINPALRGDFRAGLHCSRDGAVESRIALPALRTHLAGTGRYDFVPGREVRSVESAESGVSVRDDHGTTHHGDAVIHCPGAIHGGLTRELLGAAPPVRRVRLQMMQTAPLGEQLTTAIADSDSFRYYPGFAGDALEGLTASQSQSTVAAEHRMQLLCVQRLDGGLTIGDTHEYDDDAVFGFDVTEEPYEHLRQVVESLLGRSLPGIVRRWSGVYSQCLDPAAIAFREQVSPGVWVVTGPGGRGMTLGPAIGEQTADLMNL